ncbi:MAG: NADH-quinone oxidoreductase subunit N [Desulfobulbaceae bacterium]|nr:NADH-quinone oxidoreductase subunit N [Desulfobulbaceae bacterium]
MAILPELILLIAAVAFFVLSIFPQKEKDALSSTAIFFGCATVVASLVNHNSQAVLFAGSYMVDGFSQFFKLVMSFGLVAVLVMGRRMKDIEESVRPEYYMFLFLSTLGLMMLVSSIELIAIFVALELSSFALYLLVPMRNDQNGLRAQMEAGIKYILFGVVATGFMLYGMSYIFGLTGTTYLKEIAVIYPQVSSQPAAIFATLMVLAGFMFKLAVAPMHFWVPDIYEGASNETTGFIATLPKLGAVALLIRLINLLVPAGETFLIDFMVVAAVCSMFYGNLCALVQKDIKRMLGFSGIAHAGFVMVALLTLDVVGYSNAIFYITGYVFMNLACFLVINTVSQKGENLMVDDLKGLYKRQPVLAFIMMLSFFALAGIPPFTGFIGKFFILASALAKDHLYLVIMAAINTAIAIYYYLSVVKAAYTDASEERPMVELDGLTKFVGLALVLVIVFMGVFPAVVLDMANAAVSSVASM